MLEGCAVSTKGIDSNANQLGRAKTWSLKGKLGLQSPAENANLGIWWDQQDEAFEITFRGALSMGSGRLSGGGVGGVKGVKLEQNGEEAVYGSSPEQLITRFLGEEIPVSPMKFWVRGIPSPETSFASRDGFIEQMGWSVEYTMDSRGLPKRIILRRNEVKLKLIVKSWSY